jgi:hypothetical protein
MDGNTRICKKCLLREMDEAGFFQNMYDYIARIPADDKTPEEEYERRLSICKECEKLLSGIGIFYFSGVTPAISDSIATAGLPGEKVVAKEKPRTADPVKTTDPCAGF